MNLIDSLKKEHSRDNTMKIVNYVKAHDERLYELMNVFFGDQPILNQRASWVVGILAEETDLIRPYLHQLIDHLQSPFIQTSVKRNILRSFQFMNIPKEQYGVLADHLFSYLNDRHEAIAIKIFSMILLERIVSYHPELKIELQFSIEEQLPYSSPGFKSRGMKTLKSLHQL